MWILRMLLILILIVGLTWFAMMNSTQRATVKLTESLAFYDVPLVLLLFEAFVLGAVIWFLVSILHEVRLRTTIRRHKREIAELNQELADLRHISLDNIEHRERELPDMETESS